MRLFGVPLRPAPFEPGCLTGRSAGVRAWRHDTKQAVSLELRTSDEYRAVRLYGSGATEAEAVAKMREDLERREAECAALRRLLEAGA